MKLEHVSASSIQRFVECPSNWIINYSENLRTYSRNEYSDAGTLIHAALEMFRDPANNFDQNSYEELEACFEDVCRTHIYANNFKVYKRAKGLLAAAFRMGQVHPTVPIHLAQTISVEQGLVEKDGSLWREDWPLPSKGMIDRVAIIRLKSGKYTLFIEDYKTGWTKTHDEVVNDHIQAPMYFLFARRRLVEFLAQWGIEVSNIVGSWSYVAHGAAVPLYEMDFDHDDTEKYIASISMQMLELVKIWNEAEKKFKTEDHRNEWLSQYEKKNDWCRYCPRKNVCGTYKTMLRYDDKVDLTNPETSWLDIWQERETYRILAKNAESRASEINDVIRLHIEQEGLDSIAIPEAGLKLTANRNQNKKWRNPAVIEMFGIDFVLRSADITEAAIRKELDRIAKTDPQRAREMESLLPTLYTTVPGARPVRSSKLTEPKKSKGWK